MFSHLDEVEMTKKVRREHALLGMDAEDLVNEGDGISRRDVQPFVYPYDHELAAVGVRGIYLGNYVRWDSKRQHELMIRMYGYETAQQERTFNTYEDVGDLHVAGVHDYIKFLKHGYGRATDHACREIRLRRMSREEGIDLIAKYATVVPGDLRSFLQWVGLDEDAFLAGIDRFRDPRIWARNAKGVWALLDSVANHRDDDGVETARLPRIEDRCEFQITPSREPGAVEDRQFLMGRTYLNRYNQHAMTDTPFEGIYPEVRL